MFPPDNSKEDASGRPDPAEEWWHLREGIPAVGGEWTRSLGYFHEPWNRYGTGSDDFGEESERGCEKIATLKTCAFHGRDNQAPDVLDWT